MASAFEDKPGVGEKAEVKVHLDCETLFEYVKMLERRLRELEAERESLRRELRYYKSEVQKLMEAPLIEAIVLDTLPDGRVVVKSTTGPNLVVKVSNRVDISKLQPGMHVALNSRGSAIVDVLPQREDPYVKGFEVVERPKVRFSDVGGLKEQIRELREAIELPLKNPEPVQGAWH